MDSKTIFLQRREAYGRVNHYVIGEHAVAVKTLSRRRTVEKADVLALESLGFNVYVEGFVPARAMEVMR